MPVSLDKNFLPILTIAQFSINGTTRESSCFFSLSLKPSIASNKNFSDIITAFCPFFLKALSVVAIESNEFKRNCKHSNRLE